MSEPIEVTGQVITRPRIGRPSSYRPEYCEMLVDYFESMAVDREPDRIVKSEGATNTAYHLACKPLPTLIGFAVKIGVSRKVLGDWAEVHPLFREARARAMDIGEQCIAQDAARGLIPPIIATWLGSNYTAGLRDRKEISTTTEITVNAGTSLGKLSDAQLAQVQAWMEESQQKQLEAPSDIESTT